MNFSLIEWYAISVCASILFHVIFCIILSRKEEYLWWLNVWRGDEELLTPLRLLKGLLFSLIPLLNILPVCFLGFATIAALYDEISKVMWMPGWISETLSRISTFFTARIPNPIFRMPPFFRR